MRNWKIISPMEIPLIWGKIAHLVEQACIAGNNKYSTHYFLQILLQDVAQLWMDENNSAIITDVINFPHKKYARLIMGMGENSQDLASFIITFEEWAKLNGCHGVLSEMRLGLTPSFKDAGWQKTHVLMEKEL